MKMISLLITMGIIGFLVWKQLGGDTSPGTVSGSGSAETADTPPRISSNPQDLPQFDADMDQYLEQQSTSRRDELDRQTD